MGRRLLLWATAALCLALAACADDAEAVERRALLRFRQSVNDWERLDAAAGPGGLPGWTADSPLPHCRWGGVSCCSVSDDIADALGGRAARLTVCSLKLVSQPLQAGPAAAGAGAGTRPSTTTPQPASPAAADLEPLRELPWLVMLELSGIPVDMSSVERLLQPREPPQQLWSLVLRGAALNAPLPPRLFQAASVRELDLSHSGVRGRLPPQRHCSLQSINLAGNPQLRGALPRTLLLNPRDQSAAEDRAMSRLGTAFCDLLHLNLSSTGIRGQLPELQESAACSLATLDLSNTQLGSTLPSSWPYHSPYLFYLDLTNASLRGVVPRSWWDNAASLGMRGPVIPEYLYLGGNQLTGSVPLRWAAMFTPPVGQGQRLKATADARKIEALQARMARHAAVTMMDLIKLRDASITSYRWDYRADDQPLSTALFPGNKGLCLLPDESLGLVKESAQSVAAYRPLLAHLCTSGGGRGTVAGASLLALMLVLAATVLVGVARLCHGRMHSVGQRWWRWWRGGYLPAQLVGVSSQPRSKEGSMRSAAPAAAATSGGTLPLNVRPGRRMRPVLQAIELAQASDMAGSSREALELGSQHAQQAQQAQQCEQQPLLPPPAPPPQQQGARRQALGKQQVLGPLLAADAELPPLPLLPSAALVLPRHEGQPLMLGRTSRSMVMLGRLEGVGEVAVKALPISPQMLAVARREVRLLRRCANRHPNLVHIHGLCHAHPFLLVVTELCSGGDLQSVLHLPELRWHAWGAQVALDVCGGVAFMHSQGVVWADCKPANVLLTDRWRAKLTDLGTSRLLRTHSTAQSLATPAYAAPEQLLNGRVGLPSDVFSLGLLLHDLCTGEQPARVGGEGRACYRRPLAPGQDCPQELAQLIERCKAPLPADRPTAAAVAAALESLVTRP